MILYMAFAFRLANLLGLKVHQLSVRESWQGRVLKCEEFFVEELRVLALFPGQQSEGYHPQSRLVQV